MKPNGDSRFPGGPGLWAETGLAIFGQRLGLEAGWTLWDLICGDEMSEIPTIEICSKGAPEIKYSILQASEKRQFHGKS